MPSYNYIAVNSESKKVKGKLFAENSDELIKNLRSKQLMLTSYQELQEEVRRVYKLKANEAADFSREISAMLSAGITIIHALDIMLRRDIKEKLKAVYSAVYKNLNNGKTLSEAMEAQGEAFPRLLINMYKTGEESGHLDIVAGKMAVHYTKEHRLNNKIKSATLYPKILLGLLSIVVMVIFTLILPKFFKLFEGIQLPLVTRIVIAISNAFLHYWYLIIIGIVLLISAVKQLLKQKDVRLEVDRIKLRIPKIGTLNKIIYTARFSRTLSSLYSSGLSIVKALSVCSSTIGNTYIESQMPAAIEKVRNGDTLSSAIESIKGFDVKLPLSVYIGQESGQLDKMLDSVADSFDYEAEMAAEKLVTFLEPVLIVFMAMVVGVIALAVMLPIITLYQNIG